MADEKDIFSLFCHYHSVKAEAAKTTKLESSPGTGIELTT
jgi:hypothetical protein